MVMDMEMEMEDVVTSFLQLCPLVRLKRVRIFNCMDFKHGEYFA